MDLYIVLDSSSSIGSEHYTLAKNFLVELVKHFTISKDFVRVGLVIYGCYAKLVFDLTDSFDENEITDKIENTEYLNSQTATGEAISLMVKTAKQGARAVNQVLVPCVAIVVTDGESNTGIKVTEAVEIAKRESIEMIAYGIGSAINSAELLEIAGSREKQHKIDNFTNVADEKANIYKALHKGMYVACIVYCIQL